MRGTFRVGLATSVATLAMLGVSALPASATLLGYCAGAGQCIDNGVNSPSTGLPVNFGFTDSSGPVSGNQYRIEILTPNNETAGPSFTLTGPSGTATLHSGTWTSGNLATFLSLTGGASPTNPIGAFLDAAEAGVDPGATGFDVYQAIFGPITLQNSSNPNVSPLENITAGTLPIGSYIVAFLNEGTTENPDWVATANSGAIFDTGTPHTSIPEPASLALFGVGLLGLGLAARRRRA